MKNEIFKKDSTDFQKKTRILLFFVGSVDIPNFGRKCIFDQLPKLYFSLDAQPENVKFQS